MRTYGVFEPYQLHLFATQIAGNLKSGSACIKLPASQNRVGVISVVHFVMALRRSCKFHELEIRTVGLSDRAVGPNLQYPDLAKIFA